MEEEWNTLERSVLQVCIVAKKKVIVILGDINIQWLLEPVSTYLLLHLFTEDKLKVVYAFSL